MTKKYLETNNSSYLDITLQSLDPFVRFVDGFNLSHAGMQIKFSRNNLGLLLGGFYAPMAMFSILSMISYFIHPDNVSWWTADKTNTAS